MEDVTMQATNYPASGPYAEARDRHATARKLAIGAGLASLAFAGFAIALIVTPANSVQVKLALPTAGAAPASASASAPSPPDIGAQVHWVLAAPGRVEPRSGQIRIAAA